ncbi:MAG: NCS2 family permease [Ignavibacteriales bacterium]|nr:MAG: NCS2 family permease [Ignavibacteriales bacterium]
MLEKYFKFRENNTNIKTEILAGIATFMTMAYIIFVNPSVLKAAGIPLEPTVVSTCLVAGLITILMGLLTNYPFALAAGMGLNAFLVYGIVKSLNVSWQVAMGMVVIEGVLILVLVLTNLREAIMKAIPMDLKRAIGVGIGLFLVFLGLKDGGFVVSDPATYLTLGNFKSPGVVVSTIGVLITSFLVIKQVNGSILYGILITTVLGLFFKNANGTTITALPDRVFTDFQGNVFSTLFHADVLGALKWNYAAAIFSFFLSDFFDTMGTIILIGSIAQYISKSGDIPRLKRILIVDSLGAVLGGVFCSSSATTYIESASGVAQGGRTGFTSVVTGILFLLAIFFTPIVGMVPVQATSAALIVVGFLMMSILSELHFKSLEDTFPAFLTFITIPLTFSISNGIGIGFITYTVIKMLLGKFKEVHPLMYFVSVVFVIDFILKGS